MLFSFILSGVCSDLLSCFSSIDALLVNLIGKCKSGNGMGCGRSTMSRISPRIVCYSTINVLPVAVTSVHVHNLISKV